MKKRTSGGAYFYRRLLIMATEINSKIYNLITTPLSLQTASPHRNDTTEQTHTMHIAVQR